ncbi:CHAT domain-containing tetratricopeptide repeat protein [Luteolibacter flavescens]|uniref:CHAT domain-containing tetratricopeptide repeat protein n=1 Tax=Luteolibacter flavescens TaxID=1859460 RepID=A0ABT3FN38_9BACT|nr:CHAT domain-containing tetratricopeptide repeat protein [Luteolibacter flavescens]MCW1884614.1 CHAT domain-containing tetratricopeptide repeat protein [Luteolibacter flavescens]
MPPPRRTVVCLLILGIGAAAALDTDDPPPTEQEMEGVVAEWEEAWRENPSPENAIESGRALHYLGAIERQAGKTEEALPHLQLALERLAADTPEGRADALEVLALAEQDLGKDADAEKHLREVIELRPEGPDRIQGQEHLALNLLTQGKYPEANALLMQTLEATPAADTESRARRLGNLGRYFHVLGSHARAAETFREALGLDPGNAELRLSLSSQLALAQLRLGKTEEARRGMEETAAKARKLYRDSPFRAVPFLNNLGALDLSLGHPDEARKSFREALDLLEGHFGPEHPSLITPLNNLGSAEQAAGDYPRAETSLRRAAALQEKHLPRVSVQASETARNLARNALLSGNEDAATQIDRATALGIAVLDELIVQGSEKERLNFLQRHDLVSLACATGDAERIANVLLATKARLFDAMLTTGKSHVIPDWRTVQQALAPGSALVDACRFTTIEGEVRYGAIVLLPNGPPKWVPLGSGEDLERWLAAFRDRLAWKAGMLAGVDQPPPALKLRAILNSMHRGFWEPVAAVLPTGIQHVAFSPDGALHFLPLPALLDGEMQPLCTRFLQIATVTSGRDLLDEPPAMRLSASPWELLGVSEFPKSGEPPAGDHLLELLAGLDDMPGTADELDRLRKLAPEGSHILLDEQASERSLASIGNAPAVLHLGCHAFFLSQDVPTAAALDFDEHSDLLHAGGLLLHRAALRKPGSPVYSPDDDLLFPAEVARLPLQGTRLVTLSSCESGAGTAVSGEGLLGLRRGFALAGAREIVVALWPVSDRSTPAFMERFYQLALTSDRPAQALWQCQREFLTEAGNDNDFETAVLRYAPFVLSQNAPLATGEVIVAEPLKPGLPWMRMLLALPLLLFLAARLLKRRTAA